MEDSRWPQEGGLFKPLAEESVPRPAPPSAQQERAHDRLAPIARRLHEAMEGALQRLAEYATELSLAAAEVVVRKAVRDDRQIIQRVLSEAIRQLAEHVSAEVRVNPVDAEAVRQLCNSIQSPPRLNVVEDEDVAPGGCVLRTDFGVVDATIEEQLRRVREALEE